MTKFNGDGWTPPEPPKDPHGYSALFQGVLVAVALFFFLATVGLLVVGFAAGAL